MRQVASAAQQGLFGWRLRRLGGIVTAASLTTAAACSLCTVTPMQLQRRTLVVEFSLDALPPSLQREFCHKENARNLKYLARGSTNASACSAAVVKVLPTWVHVVSWRCTACGCQWAARPVDRTDPQVSSFYACPRCVSGTPPETSATAAASTSSSSSLPLPSPPPTHTRRLAEVYPLLAAQWDECRNTVIHNRVLFESVADVPLPCSTVVWWSCPHCRRPWRESVDSRVHRHVLRQPQHMQGSSAAVPLCPSCERRGVNGSHHADAMKQKHQHPQCSSNSSCDVTDKRFLKDDSLLLAEAQLQPHEDPAALSLHSDKLLQWRCRWCTHEFTASIADRHHRYQRCPQCSGAVATPLNLLTIQRPDIVREVARTVPHSKLRKMTIHDDKVVTFVCRTCMSPYRMSVRLRCLLQPGATACPKCLLSRSELAKEMKAAAEAGGRRGAAVRLPLKRLRLKRRNRDTLDVALNELRRHDSDLMN
ncbi:hypothetical protein DQ04_00691020 [Trypanosoma grayi]|uniref:hypothetical protein n=1 Tax=Trypanosoma grayi TaxID=71804 RepID=UPI0004F4395B|nr:hypothetical protein DQ04_00691020 [Trypanosoma grayi]KEG13956.1 hypothetical protein DQ04_00691020 [Trypanosoma grayi]